MERGDVKIKYIDEERIEFVGYNVNLNTFRRLR
jgi:hypothetical protein